MLHESTLELIKRHPQKLLNIPRWLAQGKAVLKIQIAELAHTDVASLPYRQEVLDLIHKARAAGRRVVLTTAAAPQIAHSIANHLKLFDEVISSELSRNLSAQTKARVLVERFGDGGFDYIGNAKEDLHVWRAARQVVVVSNSKKLFKEASMHGQPVQHIANSGNYPLALLKSLRPHQWLKNILVFVPLFAAHHGSDLSYLWPALLAFIAFCLTASSIYIINDLFDLSSDRLHKRKFKRPFASGEVPIAGGLVVAPILILAAIGIALLLPSTFLATLAFYMFLTTAYSLRLKRQVILDICLLAALYTIRVIAGAAATQIMPSFWLLAFSLFIFVSLALVKRYTELLDNPDPTAPLPGRGYRSGDMMVLMSLGTSSGMLSVLVLALYISSPNVAAMYQEPLWLWSLPPAALYWTSRLWMKAQRGEIHDDPVIFAIRDRQSLLVVLLLTPVLIAASVGWQPWL